MWGSPDGNTHVAVRLRASRLFLPLDVLLSGFGYFVAIILRFNGNVTTEAWNAFLHFLPIAVVVHLAASCLAGVYNREWRHASTTELGRVLAAGFAAGAVLFALSFALARSMPRSVIIFGTVVAVTLLGSVRLCRHA
jgi:FlaA1/EpsC-like NDP-sugar epimerase